jgi:putative oxidoreductase
MRPTMPAFITFGRVLFAVLFIFSGASKLLDLTATAQMTEKIVLPAALATYTSQLEGIAGMAMPQMLAIATGALELICGLMIALNFGARFFAIVLILFVAAATFYFHDFWNQTGADARNNMIHALKNLSIIGALFMIAGYGRMSRTVETTYGDV